MSSMNKKVVLTSELFDCGIPYLREYFEAAKYPWELLPQIKEIIKKVLENGLPGYHLLKEGVLVGDNVSIAETATIIAPAIIGANSVVTHDVPANCIVAGVPAKIIKEMI